MELKLPTAVSTRSDLLRLNRELMGLERFLDASRQRGEKVESLPKMSLSLTKFLETNSLDVSDPIVLKTAIEFMSFLKTKAPVLHISFASDPSAQTLVKLVSWLRDNIHPQVLIELGIQPSIAGGCIVRSNNKVFDFSLRKHFANKKSALSDTLKNARLDHQASSVEEVATA